MSADAGHRRDRSRAQGHPWLPGTPAERWTFAALMALATLLRCWDLTAIPYTHDEISALVRIFPSLGETIRTGVIAHDTHPPGTQVFEWAWTQLFGMDEAVVKAPFILFSLAGLFLLYRFAFAWCGATVALISLAFLATLQYTVMYGQIARPYAMGFFSIALLADRLTRYLVTGRRCALVGLAVAALISAYTHHFAALLAGSMWLTGLFLVLPEQRRAYLITGTLIVLGYAPNIPILLHQLGQGGLQDWLRAPEADWLPDHAWWLAHCSVLFGAVWAFVLGISLVLRSRYGRNDRVLWSMALAWGALPLVVGYLYSLWHAPVLQYSVVLFSFPFLLIPALSGLHHLRPGLRNICIVLVVIVATVTLVGNRKHYQAFYRSKYEAIVHGIVTASSVPDRLALVDAPDEVIRFYLERHGTEHADLRYVNVQGRSVATLDSVLARGAFTSVFYGSTAGAGPENVAFLQRRFPFLRERHDFVEGQCFLFNALPDGTSVDDVERSSLLTPQALRGAGWQVDGDLPQVRDSAADVRIAPMRWDLRGREYGVVFEALLDSMTTDPNALLEAIATVPTGNARFVMELRDGDSTVFYRFGETVQGTAITAIKLADLTHLPSYTRVKAYIWNWTKGPAHVAAVEVRVRTGDPWLYGAYGPLLGPLRYP